MQSCQSQKLQGVHGDHIDEGIVDDQSNDKYIVLLDSAKLCHSQLPELSIDEVDKALIGQRYYTLRQLSDYKSLPNVERVTVTVVGQPKKAVRARNPKEIVRLRKTSPNAVGSSIGSSIEVKISSTASVTGTLLAILVHPSSTDGLHQVSLFRMISRPNGNCTEMGFYEEPQIKLDSKKEVNISLKNIGLVVDIKEDQQAFSDKLTFELRKMFDDPRFRPLFENMRPDSSLKAPLQVDPMKNAEQSFQMFFTFVPDNLNDGKDWEIGCCVSHPVDSTTGSDGGKSDLVVVDHNPRTIPLSKVQESQNIWVPKEDLWIDLNRKIGSKDSLTAELIVDFTNSQADPPHVELELQLSFEDSRVKLHMTKMDPNSKLWSLMLDDGYDAKISLTYKKCRSGKKNATDTSDELACELPIRFYFLQAGEPVRKKLRQELEASSVSP